MPHQLVVIFFGGGEVATPLHPSRLKSSIHASTTCSLMFFFDLEAIGNIHRLIFTLTIHPLCQFMLMLPLLRNRRNDMQGKSKGWLLYNGKNPNPRHYLFHVLFLT